MIEKRTIIFGLCLWLASPSLAVAAGAGLLPYRSAVDVAAGKQIYDSQCAACHGAALEGQANWRIRDEEGYLPAPPHDATGHTWHHRDAQLFAIVKYGIEALVGNGYKSQMGGYGDTLSDQEITQVLAYIKSTWPEPVIAQHNLINQRAD